jgi:hypothetical protein
VSLVSFTPDGHDVIAATPEAAHVIGVAANQEIASIPLSGPAGALRYVEGGRYVELAALTGNNVRITRDALRPVDLIQAACTLVERNLTIPEWNAYIGPGVPYRRTCANLPFPPR